MNWEYTLTNHCMRQYIIIQVLCDQKHTKDLSNCVMVSSLQ